MVIGEFDYFGPGPVRKKNYASYFYQRTVNGEIHYIEDWKSKD